MNGEHPELGYVFEPYSSGSSLGYAGLDVFLVAAGQDKGFAPAQLIVPAWGDSAADGVSRLTLTVHWPSTQEIHVAPGLVTIRSHGGGEQEAYCFGGSLTCQCVDDRLHCRLTSAAPILNLGEEGLDWPENAALRVVDSIESDLASCRAQFAGDEEATFDARLARTDPRLLYAVGLTLAQHSFAMLPEVLRTEHYWDEYSALTRALQEAQKESWWPGDPSLPAVLPPAPPATAKPG